MPAIHVPYAPLTLRAGAHALALVRSRGLRPDDVDIVPGASGGAKWLAIGGLDRAIFGEFLQVPRDRPLHAIGSSIGSWRMACLAQADPVAALARGHDAYIHDQQYSARPDTREVTDVLGRALDRLLGPEGVDQILSHPTVRVHVITAIGRGLAASTRRPILASALALAAAANAVSRRTLGTQFTRCLLRSGDEPSPFAHLDDLPTVHARLTRDNLRAALLASGSIPLLLEGVAVPDAPGRVHWDGGVTDYHLDLDFGAGDGLVLYPHFYAELTPGWFDKRLRHRRGRARTHSRTLLIAPSAEFVARLPGGRIPDRRDFFDCTPEERVRRWSAVLAESERLGDAWRAGLGTDTLVRDVRAW